MTTWNYNYRIYPVKGILHSQPVLEAHGKGAIAIICFVRGRFTCSGNGGQELRNRTSCLRVSGRKRNCASINTFRPGLEPVFNRRVGSAQHYMYRSGPPAGK